MGPTVMNFSIRNVRAKLCVNLLSSKVVHTQTSKTGHDIVVGVPTCPEEHTTLEETGEEFEGTSKGCPEDQARASGR